MDQKWNEHIEEIIINKSFDQLNTSDFQELGEIAEDKTTYNSYRSLLTEVLPLVHAENIQPSDELNAKIDNITKQKQRKWYTSIYFKYASAAAILLLIVSSVWWFLDHSSSQKEEQLVQNNTKVNTHKQIDQDSNRHADEEIAPRSANEKSLESEAELSKDDDLCNESMTEKKIDDIPESEITEQDALTPTNDELSDKKYTEKPVKRKRAAEPKASGASFDTPAEKSKDVPDVRNALVGSVRLSKPASEEPDAFSLLKTAY